MSRLRAIIVGVLALVVVHVFIAQAGAKGAPGFFCPCGRPGGCARCSECGLGAAEGLIGLGVRAFPCFLSGFVLD